MDLVAKAIELAARHHAGVVDKAGAPYVLHPMRIMLKMTTPEQRMAAAMHDVIEDCDVTPETLLAEGFPPDVVEAVLALTRRPDETYMEFVQRARANPIALPVKIADIEDNMDLSRIAHPTEKDYARIERYREALAFLQATD